MNNILFNKTRNQPALLLATVLGRLPIWVLLLALAGGMLHKYAFGCLYSVLLICRAYLTWYENGSGGPKLLMSTLWKNCFGWVLRYIFLEIVLFAIGYVLVLGDRVDWILLLMALGLYIPVVILGILIPARSVALRHVYLRRTAFMKTAVVLLWFYVVLTGEMALFKLMAMAVIYTLEFFSIYELPGQAEEGVPS